MSDVMLDLETLGTGPAAAIVAIGAVIARAPDVGFYCRVDLASAVADGGEMAPDTVLWWLAQPDAARLELCGPGMPIRDALERFTKFPELCPEPPSIWGNGAAFDNVILADAYRRAGLQVPWTYRNDRCYRTLAALHPEIPLARTGTHHNALDDARTQALHWQRLMEANRRAG